MRLSALALSVLAAPTRRKVKKGLVLSETPKAGKKLANRAKVNLVVSRGKRPPR